MESPHETCQSRVRIQRKCKDVTSRYMQRSTVSFSSSDHHQRLTTSPSGNHQEESAPPPPTPLPRQRPKTPNNTSPRSAAPQNFNPTRSVIESRRSSRIERNQQVASYNQDNDSVNAALCKSSVLSQGTSLGGVLKPWASPKKKKVVGGEEDGHIIRLLQNQYLQWRFVNAKLEFATRAKQRMELMSVYSASAKLLELRNSVVANKSKLAWLKNTLMVCSILKTQIPFLDEWSSDLEEGHSVAISGTIQAMRNASLRLPLVNATADIREVSRVLQLAEQVMELVSALTGVFSRQADETNNIVSDITNVMRTEISLMEVCRDLMADAQKWQVTEESLRSAMMQFGQIVS